MHDFEVLKVNILNDAAKVLNGQAGGKQYFVR
jgi:hypothetical protein